MLQRSVLLALCALCVSLPLLVASPAPIPDFVRVPGGKFMHKDCVYTIPNGAHLVEDADADVVRVMHQGKEVMTVGRCAFPMLYASSASASGVSTDAPSPLHGPAWKSWAWFDTMSVAEGEISMLQSQWVVPEALDSAGAGEILYLWNGLEPHEMTAVLQPVLQWGSTPAGGGSFWAAASWYVSSSHGSFNTDLIKTPSGSTITGINRQSDSSHYYISAECSTTGESAHFSYQPASTSYTGAYPAVDETYSISTSCQDAYPANAVAFSNITLAVGGQPVTPKWMTETKDNTCGEHATVESNEHVTLHFSASN